MRKLQWLLAMLVAVALAPVSLLAQEPAVVTGRVTNASGQPENAVLVRIDALNVGTTTTADGSYRLVVPASRVRAGQQVTITASRVGLASSSRQVTLNPGATLTANFQLGADVLQLEALVATGQGTVQERRAVASTINQVSGQAIEQSNEDNIVSALAGKAPNVQVTTSSGDPGSGAYITIRGAKTLAGDTQPLFVVDGVPIDNGSYAIETTGAGTAVQNRAADINPNDIESVEILKGAAAGAIYGSRAANGVVLITTKSGRRGSTRVSFKTSYSTDEVTETVPLQTRFGQGVFNPATNTVSGSIRSWGREIPAGTPVYDHAGELFDTGNQFENNLTLSGGSDRTTYFLSLGNLAHEGVLRGNSEYNRTTVRLKGDHNFTDRLRIGGNFAYTRSEGDLVQQGSNISGVLLGGLRTPPEFNNCRSPEEGGTPGKCWLNAQGLHFSYINPNPGGLAESRGFDNPFYVMNELTNTSNVGRFFGNVNLEYQALSWLNISYVLGADYANDARLTVFPKGSSDFPVGRMIRADLLNEQYDHSLLATANYTVGEQVTGSVTVGQNLNQQEFSRYQVNGSNLVFGTDQLDFTIDREPNEFRSKVRTDGYFVQATADVADRLFLTGALRLDGSSTFGGDGERFLYPKVSAAYDFSTISFFDRLLDFAKIRAAYGVAGTQPPPYSNTTSFNPGTYFDSWISPNGLNTIYGGSDGVAISNVLGNENITPERTSEFEAGVDLAFLDSRVSLGVTYYASNTTDAIIGIPLSPSTGYTSQIANAAEFSNKGWEVTLDLNPVQRENVSWTVGFQWATNQGCVENLAGAEEFSLNGFVSATSSLVAPERDEDGNITRCYDYGTLYGRDFVRFGRGLVVGGVNIDNTFDAPDGALYVGANGFPILDPQSRALGDPNPDWTGSLRSSLTLFNNLQISGLLDVKHGGEMWNGTAGALYGYGTHKDTEAWHGTGQSGVIFGQNYLQGQGVGGPGAGREVTLNAGWGNSGLGNGFNGPASQFIEDAGFVKLRDITVSYTLDQPFVRRYGFSSIELNVSGRNLKTWTDYTGIDPESNLTGQSAGRGLDYFNNPRTRSFVLGVTLNR